jgi:phospholipase B1, membrane-associated
LQIEPNIFNYPKLVSGARRQQLFPKRMQLPCHNVQMRSSTPPNSVHELRPGDIDVVAALGDSLIAGNGAMEEFAAGTFFEHRGVSWCAGKRHFYSKYPAGDRKFLTTVAAEIIIFNLR